MAKAIYAADQPPSFLAGWSSRLAVFCLVLLIVTAFLHRLLSLPTAIALNIVAACFAGAVLALIMAVIAGLDVWFTGRQGAPRIVVGGTIALALLAVPGSLYILSRDHPPINDITTDTTNPPAFTAAAALRRDGSNPIAYPGAEFAGFQSRYYPDIKPMNVPRPAEEAYELVLQALAKLRYKVSRATPPDTAKGVPGSVELTDYTLVLGFGDDVAIRVASSPSNDGASIVDVRSASQYGVYDFGHNVERVRIILREIVGRLEASVPAPFPGKDRRPTAAQGTPDKKPKRSPARDLELKDDRRQRRPAQ